MKSKSITLVILLFCYTGRIFSQEFTISNVEYYKMRSSGNIMDKNTVKGYFSYYDAEKVDKKFRVFNLCILDENLNQKSITSSIEPKSSFLVAASSNGFGMLFKFYDYKSHQIGYRSLNAKGELREKIIRDASPFEIEFYRHYLIEHTEQEKFNLNPFGNNFIDIYTIRKDKILTYNVICLDSTGKTLWSYSPDHKKGVDQASFLNANSDQLILFTEHNKNRSTYNVSFGITVLNSNGTLNLEIDMISEMYNLMPHNAYIDNETSNLIVIGEYYDINDRTWKAESLGVFVRIIDGKGNIIKENYISWDKDVYSKVDETNKKEIQKNHVHFHEIVKTADGKILAIGEQYRKQLSATAMALKLSNSDPDPSGNTSNLELRIGNLIILELSSDFSLSKTTIIDKSPTHVFLSKSNAYSNQHYLSRAIKAKGYFDYSFIITNSDNSQISICYIDNEEIKGKLAKRSVFNAVHYSTTDPYKYSYDKLELNTDASFMSVHLAKEGYIMIEEYYNKTKTLRYSLEPLKF